MRFASSSMPIQRSFRISLMRSFDARRSIDSEGFGSPEGFPTGVFPILLSTIDRDLQPLVNVR